MLKLTRRNLFAALVVTATALTATACSPGQGESVPSASVEATATIEDAKASVASLENPPAFEVQALSGEVPTDKVVGHVNCGAPVCSPGSLNEPARALGWQVDLYEFDLGKGAEDFLRAFDSAIAAAPDYLVVNLNYGTEIAQRQLAAAEEAGIPVVGAGAADVSQMALMTQSPVALEQAGTYMADVAASDAGEAIHVAIPTDMSLPSLASMTNGAVNRVTEFADSTADVIELSFNQPQPTNVSAITNYLQSHPETDYLLFPGSGFYPGVSQALNASGLGERVKLILALPGESDVPAIANEEFTAAVAGEFSYHWRQIDALARLAVGDAIETKTPSNHFRLLTSENLAFEGIDPANFKEVYLEAWGV